MSAPATLIAGPSWVGDMIMAQSLCMLLKEREPARALDLLAPAWSLPVVARMPEVRDGIVLPAAHGELALGRRRRLARRLRERGYDRAIVLPRSLKAALVPWWARIPRRTGFRGELRYGVINDMRPFYRAALEGTVKRFVALGLEPGEALPATLPEPSLGIDPDNRRRLLETLSLATERPVVALLPGAEYGPAKRWPLAKFRELAASLTAAGRAVWVLGAAAERDDGAAIAAGSGAVNLCGRTALVDVVDLLSLCTHAVSNDSGLMHMAAAAGVHVVAIYGSTSPRFTPPLTAASSVHYLGLECSPCFRRECPLGHLRCLREIEPESVLASVTGRQ